MSKKSRQHKHKRAKARRPSQPRHDSSAPGLLEGVVRNLSDPHPLGLLSYVSTLMAVMDRRGRNPFAGPDTDHDATSLDEFAGMLIEAQLPETTALLRVIAELGGADDLLRTRIRRELSGRLKPQVRWLAELSEPSVYRALRMSHALGDGDDIILGARLAGGHELTIVVYIDHNVGTLVKDAFVVPAPIAEVFAQSQQIAEADTSWDELSFADARAWVQDGIERAAITYPPFESDSWPGCRALVEWVIRTLPTGGTGHQPPQWDERKTKQLADKFFASPDGAGLDDAEHRDLLESLLWYGTDYGPGDPLRWSPVGVEILLADWIPRKIVAPSDYLAKAPDLLRAFIRFAHTEVGLKSMWTDQALAAVDEWEPEYQSVIRSERLQGPAALLAQMGLDVDEDGWLAAQVGGQPALDALDDAPLPDEPFCWDGIPEDAAPRVAEVLTLVDRCCDELLDVEYRTACRRLFARIASSSPSSFSRGRVETVAGAVVWIIGKANDLFGLYGTGMHVKDLLSQFGIRQGGVSQRAETLLRAGGFHPSTHELRLGSPDYLVSSRRRHIIELRDR
ncbi:DUF6398 domain-containing protein [Mycobacterium sp. 21AC1]|uniref:DUF6398 domain-containing protein n=1 Tax=[Mycobacterium] appelbergii TaxID=2939269 RepID=UPI002939067A|nr:DUF6398 domain-containing protein [Mycobacterium sp. 21AC1]MDV3127923.1 DUF6398 domain-containing protein [Mycobacterium sp. 21AC1]